MLKEGTSRQSGSAAGRGQILQELLAALESAGVSGERVTRAVTESLAGNGAPAGRAHGAVVLSPNARTVLEKRYLRKDSEGKPIETPEDLFHRVAGAIAMAENEGARRLWEGRFYELLASLKFLPNSPTLVNAGTDKGCLSACFVVSPEDTMESIMSVAHDAAMIEKWGGGIGFGFSRLRPRNDKIRTTHGSACGPVAVMKLYSAVGATLTQGAFRLGAHMGQLRDSHPDVREFIHCKDGDDAIQNFNISVQITDAFMRAVETGGDWSLVNPRNGETVATVPARELWNEICESAWKTGDPGVVYMDRVWETAPNPQLGPIQTSNPCGEEFLEDHGNCCLGSINLDRHIAEDDFDWALLEQTVRTAVRFLDDVIEVNAFPLPKLREVNLATRRIGLGVMGWADALVRLSVPYDSEDALAVTDKVAGFINTTAWDESHKLAEERGPFPEYERSALKERGMPPVRNSSVITIAPTGTISRIAGCSSGIEPHFAIAWWSNVLWDDQKSASSRLLDAPTSVWETLEAHLGDREQVRAVLERIAAGPEEAEAVLAQEGITPALYRTAMAISPQAHVRMQAAWQKHVTNSVSKTINLPNSATVKDISDAFLLAWETGCKAVTVYRDGSKSMQVLETGHDKVGQHSAKAEARAEGVTRVPKGRPQSIAGVTERVRTGHGNMYVTVNFDDRGRPFEVFTTLGKAGGCDSAQLEAISRLVSMALRSGVDPHEIVTHLRGITCCPFWDEGTLVRSAPDAVSLVLGRHLQGPASTVPSASNGDSVAVQPGLFPANILSRGNGNTQPSTTKTHCPDCSAFLIHQEGCLRCAQCGYNKCE